MFGRKNRGNPPYKKMKNVSDEIKKFLPVTLELAKHSQVIYSSSQVIEQSSRQLVDLTEGLQNDTNLNTNNLNIVQEEMELISLTTEKINTHAKENEALSKENLQNVILCQDSLSSSMDKIQQLFGYYDYLHNSFEKLQGYSEHIANITTYIDQIAAKTSLLSINASIEAARAGEAGRGFKVITEEIKKLADQSKQFSQNIDETIKGIAACIDEVKNSSNQTYEEITITNQTITTTKKSLERISDSTNQLDQNIHATLISGTEIQSSVESGKQKVAHLSNTFANSLESISNIVTAIQQENKAVHQLITINEKVKEVSEKQLGIVLGDDLDDKLCTLAQAVIDYNGSRDRAPLKDWAMKQCISYIYYTNCNGIFIAGTETEALGLKIFDLNPDYSAFASSNEDIKLYPMTRNMYTGEILRFMVAKEKGTNNLISIGFNLDHMVEISQK